MKRALVSLFAATALLVGAVAPIAAQAQTDPAAVVQQLLTAVNRNDLAAQVALFTDDAILIGGPCREHACVGKSAIQRAFTPEDGGGVQVRFAETPQVAGDVVRFRLEERFPLPPGFQAPGVERLVEVGTAVVSGGKIAHLAFVADLTDAQTVTLIRLFASFGPDPGQLPAAYIARDGQSLVMQSAAAQLAFITTWGEQAHVRWAEEHNAELARQGR